MHAPSSADPYEHGLRLSAAGRHAEAIGRYEAALASRPDDARVLFALGNTARILDLPGPAEDFLRRVLALSPGRIEALVTLANILRPQGRFDEAGDILSRALGGTPEAPELWLTLGSVRRETGDTDGAAAHYRKALELRPDYPQALGNLADILSDRGDTETAIGLYDRVLAAEPNNVQARLNRAILHLLRGDLAAGWKDYAARLKIPGKVPVPDHNLARWNGGSLRRTRLLVTAEQGIGDQIMFASLFPDLIARAARDGGSVVLECEPRLVPLFARSFPAARVAPWQIETRGGVTRARYDWLRAAGGATMAIEMGSLPKHLRARVEDFPDANACLVPDAGEQARWRAWLAAHGVGPFIGLCWRSGVGGGHRAVQYAPIEAWADMIARLPGTPVCTQYDATPDEIALLEKRSGKTILVPPGIDQKHEIDRTVAMLSALDAVISAPTAVSWLAAGAGVPTVKVLYDTSWTSFGAAREPFAPAAHLARPATPGDWHAACARALETVTRLIRR